MSEPQVSASPRSTLRRKRERGSHDRETINAILDEALICHVGFTDGGSTFVVPTAFARVGDELFLHGAAANHMLRTLASGIEACVTVTLVDALVLARSAFHHSMNYRSVMLFGTADKVVDPTEKRAALLATVDHMAPGRSRDARTPTDTEMRSTLVVRFPIRDGSCKVRTGGPIEEPEDLALAVWAGQLPFELRTGAPLPDDGLADGVAIPAYVADYPSRPAPAVSR